MLLAALTVLGAAGLWAQDAKKNVRFAVDPTYPPLEFLENGNVVGYGVDYFAAVCQEAGLKVEFLAVEWEGIFDRLNSGEYEAVMSSVTITPERRKTMDFTIPYYIVRQSLIVPQNSSIDNIRQLNGLRIGSQVDTTATEIAEKVQNVQSMTFPSVEESIKALAAGQVDAVICEDVVGGSFLSRAEFSGKIKMASVINTPGAEEIYAVAVRKGNLEILVPLNDGIKAVKAKGIEAELRRKWIGN